MSSVFEFFSERVLCPLKKCFWDRKDRVFLHFGAYVRKERCEEKVQSLRIRLSWWRSIKEKVKKNYSLRSEELSGFSALGWQNFHRVVGHAVLYSVCSVLILFVGPLLPHSISSSRVNNRNVMCLAVRLCAFFLSSFAFFFTLILGLVQCGVFRRTALRNLRNNSPSFFSS